MGFAKEIEDFLNGYKAVSAISGDAEDRKLRRDKLALDAADSRHKEMETLATPTDKYSPRGRASKRTTKATTADPGTAAAADLIAPYGDNPGEADTEDALQMFDGGLVTSPGNKRQALPMDEPEDNEGSAAARAQGKRFYTDSENRMMPLYAPSGRARNTYGETAQPGPKGSSNAIKAAMDVFATQAKAPKSAVGGPENDLDLATNKGAATPAEVKAIDAKIDPNNEMDPWTRGRKRLDEAYEYYVSRGEPEKAANVAARLLLFDKMSSQARGTMAVNMISSGNSSEAAQVLMDAYNENIHDGGAIEIKPAAGGKFTFKITKDGETVEQGQGTAADMAAVAGNVANGSEFVERYARLAASEAAPGEAPPPAQQPAAAIPTEPAASEAEPEAAPAEKPVPASGRDISWAKKQYIYAASVLKSWQDEAKKKPTPENLARLKDAQIRLSEAEQDAVSIRLRAVKVKTADRAKIQLDFEDDLADWREAADPLDELPPPPKDGLRGAKPAPAAPAVQPASPAVPTAVPGAAAPAAQPTGQGVNWVGYVMGSGGGSQWDVGGQRVNAPPPDSLKPMPPELIAEAKKAMAEGTTRLVVVRKLLTSGFNPEGI